MTTFLVSATKRGLFVFAVCLFGCSCSEITKKPTRSDACGGAVVKIDDNLSERYLVPEYAEPGNEQFDRYRGSAPVYDFQRAAGFLGYAFTATDSHNTALFMYKPHTNYSFKQYDNLLFEREACALQLEDRKLVLHY